MSESDTDLTKLVKEDSDYRQLAKAYEKLFDENCILKQENAALRESLNFLRNRQSYPKIHLQDYGPLRVSINSEPVHIDDALITISEDFNDDPGEY